MRERAKDSAERFTGLADVYAQCRPDYPTAAIDFILCRCGLKPGDTLVDIGSGTGISSRLFAARGLRVIGIDPNADMRRRAEAEPAPPDAPSPVYRDGRGEATGLPDASADVVLAAQAFHWCEPEAAFNEFQRILKPRGWVVLMWNERDERDAFTAAYGDVIRTARETARIEGKRQAAAAPLLTCPLFEHATRTDFPHTQIVDEDGMIGRAMSASYAPREAAEVEQFKRALRDLFARFQQAGRVTICYQTSVYSARKKC